MGSICWNDGCLVDYEKVGRIFTLSHNLAILRGSAGTSQNKNCETHYRGEGFLFPNKLHIEMYLLSIIYYLLFTITFYLQSSTLKYYILSFTIIYYLLLSTLFYHLMSTIYYHLLSTFIYYLLSSTIYFHLLYTSIYYLLSTILSLTGIAKLLQDFTIASVIIIYVDISWHLVTSGDIGWHLMPSVYYLWPYLTTSDYPWLSLAILQNIANLKLFVS